MWSARRLEVMVVSDRTHFARSSGLFRCRCGPEPSARAHGSESGLRLAQTLTCTSGSLGLSLRDPCSSASGSLGLYPFHRASAGGCPSPGPPWGRRPCGHCERVSGPTGANGTQVRLFGAESDLRAAQRKASPGTPKRISQSSAWSRNPKIPSRKDRFQAPAESQAETADLDSECARLPSGP